MAKARFLASSGTGDIRFLWDRIIAECPELEIRNDPVAGRYFSRAHFRKVQELSEALNDNQFVATHFNNIEAILDSGRDYTETGWSSYAWLPYLLQRFHGRIEFAHFVLSPFDAAGLSASHGIFGDDHTGRYHRRLRIHGSGNLVKYEALAAKWKGFNRFEKALYFWLETNRFFLALHPHPGFRGVFHFDGISAQDGKQFAKLCSALTGKAFEAEPAITSNVIGDKMQEPITYANQELIEAVFECALALGFELSDLERTADLTYLSQQYVKSA